MTYFCCQQCPGNPWSKHRAWHEKHDAWRSDLNAGGVHQQAHRELAEQQARYAESTAGSEYMRLMADASRHLADQNYLKADHNYRKAIALEPGQPEAYYNLGVALGNAGRHVEAAPHFLQAAALFPEGSEDWVDSIAAAFDKLRLPECAEVAKPEWWNDEGLKALSKTMISVPLARVFSPAGDARRLGMHGMRAAVLSGWNLAWESGPRSSAELKEAAEHYGRAAQLTHGPSQERELEIFAAALRRDAAAMEAAEAKTRAVARAKEEAAAVEVMLAEEEAEIAAVAKRAVKALRALGDAPGKAKAKGKAKGKGSGIQAVMLCV